MKYSYTQPSESSRILTPNFNKGFYILFQYMYCASLIILYSDKQIRNYFTNYHNLCETS